MKVWCGVVNTARRRTGREEGEGRRGREEGEGGERGGGGWNKQQAGRAEQC